MLENRESYYDYMGRRMREEDAKIMTDEQMIEHLRSHAHWTVKKPWVDIANRLEELSNKEKT
jgi:hypothetical protein